MSFQLPLTSSPAPSTPDKRSRNASSFFNGLSTTPAGAPPSSAASFTPAGEPPPSSIFGSSMADPSKVSQPFGGLGFTPSNTGSNFQGFKSVNTAPPSSPPAFPPQSIFAAPASKPSGSNPFASNPFGSSLFQAPEGQDEEEDEDEDEDAEGSEEVEDEEEEEDEESDEDAMAEDDDEYEDEDAEGDSDPDRMEDDVEYSDDNLPLTQPRLGDTIRTDTSLGNLQDRSPSGEQSSYDFIAKEMYNRLGNAELNESADLILNTEEIILRLYDEGLGDGVDPESLKMALSTIPSDLIQLWQDYAVSTASHQAGEYTATIGPGPQASDFENANFLASLVLPLYQPPAKPPRFFDSQFRGSSTALVLREELNMKSVPEILLEWLDLHHNPYPSQLQELRNFRPSPSANRLFWQVIFNNLLRGRIQPVIEVLKHAGWQNSKLSLDEARDPLQQGYSGETLAVVERIVGEAINILSNSPVTQANWDVSSSEWILFRLRTKGARENLRILAEGRDAKGTDAPLQAENFGIGTGSQAFSQRAKKAGSKVPWDIYQNLMAFYGLLMGDAEAITSSAEDWVEATIGLLVWGSEHKDQRRPNYPTHAAMKSSYARDMQWLAQSFRRATSHSPDFEINTLNPIEVSLAAVFEGNIEHVIGFLRAWSGPISSSVAEIASLGRWVSQGEPQLISMDNFGLDQEDMDVLGVGSQPDKDDGVKDRTLIAYARLLTNAGTLETKTKLTRQGWEMAMALAGRMDSAPRSEEIVHQILQEISLETADDVDKSCKILSELGMVDLAEKTAENYANQIAEDTHRYGEALWYYALSHNSEKVREVLNLLISFSLIQSTAFPAEADMDEHLRRLIFSPKETLTELSNLDYEAALLLHKMLSGYGTLRKFYELRDDQGSRGTAVSVTRKVQAAAALIGVITSSDDNIRGGLYDESREAVVSVDFLLALLGEALVFVNQPEVLLTTSQMEVLLKSIEDLETVSKRIYKDSSDFFDTVLASTQGLSGSTPRDLLKKSTSSLSGTSSFSMVGSSMYASQLKRSMSGSGVLVEGNIKRGWDWRKALMAGTQGEDVLRILRLGLAKDLGRVWLLEADGQL